VKGERQKLKQKKRRKRRKGNKEKEKPWELSQQDHHLKRQGQLWELKPCLTVMAHTCSSTKIIFLIQVLQRLQRETYNQKEARRNIKQLKKSNITKQITQTLSSIEHYLTRSHSSLSNGPQQKLPVRFKSYLMRVANFEEPDYFIQHSVPLCISSHSLLFFHPLSSQFKSQPFHLSPQSTGMPDIFLFLISCFIPV
jgi:hypothetical protein